MIGYACSSWVRATLPGTSAGGCARLVTAPRLSSRCPPSSHETPNPDWLSVDVSDRDRVRTVVRSTRPDAVVAVHGPSDITWCEANPEQALAVHWDGARHLAEVLDGRRVVLISTDNSLSWS
ncbi:MAG: sugar nucleotide-binding protein [Pseudonocardiales bacterium]|nr:sugar nucleotide-binding protein [Pseudonocardiales bacterium]